MKTLSLLFTILCLASLTVYSQPVKDKQAAGEPAFGPKLILGLNPQEQESRAVCTTRLDSIKRTLPTQKLRIHSKTIPMSSGQITVHLTQTWFIGTIDSAYYVGWMNYAWDSTITNSFGEVVEYWQKSWYRNDWMNYCRTYSTYDAKGNVTSFLYQTWNVTSWLNNYQQFYTYDGQGHETSFYLQNWVSNAWVNSYKDIYAYNASGYQTNFLCQTGVGADWVNVYQYNYAPDAHGRDTIILYQLWNDTSWSNANQTTVVLNANGNVVSQLTSDWYDGVWINASLINCTYDAKGRETNELDRNWVWDTSPDQGVWTNYRQFFYTYDANGNVASNWYRQWKNNAWLNQWMFNFTYDAQGDKTSLLKQIWKAGAWISDYEYLYSYDANGLETGYILLEGYTGALENALQHIYVYDASGNCTRDLCQGWNNPNWVNANQTLYIYDVNGNLASNVYQTWSGSAWLNYSQDLYTFNYAGTKSATSLSVDVGWNIVSVPMFMDDYSKSTLFPTAISPAFGYQGSYVTPATLKSGIGYWLKFSGPQTIPLTGYTITLDSIKVNTGWNLIGSISAPVPVTNVGSIPGGIITSDFFGYTKSYGRIDTIMPGQGYWVKVNQGGKLVLSSLESIPAAARVRIEPGDEMPPTPPTGDVTQGREGLPLVYQLEQNYPNPFNPSTVVHYSLPSGSHVRLAIYNMLGQEVMRVVDEYQDAGYKSRAVDLMNLPSGVYIYRLTAGAFTDVKKMALIK